MAPLGLPRSLTTRDQQLESGGNTELGPTAGRPHFLLVPSLQD